MFNIKGDREFLSIFLFAVSVSAALALSPKQHTVKVCQHKNCIKQYKDGNLLETIQNLIPPESTDVFSIESSGCLSGCGKGPNIETNSKADGKSMIYGNVDSPHAVSEVLQSRYSLECPTILIAACNVMAQANTLTSFKKKNKYLSSIIESLSSDPDLATSRALVMAYLLRADARLLEMDVTGAVRDCQIATQIDADNGKAWRQLAEALEVSGDVLGALEAVTKWAQIEQVFATKARKEVDRLKIKLSG